MSIKMERQNGQNSFLSAAILVIALLAAYAVLIMPAIDMRNEHRQQIEELQFQYSRFAKLANQRDNIKQQLGQLRKQQANSTGFLEDKPESLAAADLQNHIRNLIETKGGTLISTQVVQHKSASIFPDVRIRIQMRAGMKALQEVIYALESGQPTLLLDNVYLQRRNIRIAPRSIPGVQTGHPAELIDARFEVTGFIFHSQEPSRS